MLRDPVAIHLCHRVRGTGVERGGLFLGNLLHLAEQLGSRRLVNAGGLRKTRDANCLQHPQHTDAVRVGGIFRLLERNCHMGLGRQVIDFVRLDFQHQAHQIHRVCHVAVDQMQAVTFRFPLL